MLSDGDAEAVEASASPVMPEATLVLDWWHIAMRFEHASASGPRPGREYARLATTLRGYAGFADLEELPSGCFGTVVRVPASGAFRETGEAWFGALSRHPAGYARRAHAERKVHP